MSDKSKLFEKMMYSLEDGYDMIDDYRIENSNFYGNKEKVANIEEAKSLINKAMELLEDAD